MLLLLCEIKCSVFRLHNFAREENETNKDSEQIHSESSSDGSCSPPLSRFKQFNDITSENFEQTNFFQNQPGILRTE